MLVVRLKGDTNFLEYFPSTCSKESTGCYIVSKGIFSRKYCYDFPSPMLLQIPQYYCKVHKQPFSLLVHMQQNKAELVNNVCNSTKLLIAYAT